MNQRGNVKYLVDIEKTCLMTNFEKRNWVRGSEGILIYIRDTETSINEFLININWCNYNIYIYYYFLYFLLFL